MNFQERPLIITDLETTHLDPTYGEVLQIGAVRVDQKTLAIEALFQAKLEPLHICTAQPKSLEVNGYTPEAWADAVSQEDGFKSFFSFARQGVFCSYAVQFDWGFLKPVIARHYHFSADQDRQRFGPFDRHLIDVPSIAWGILGPMPKIRKNAVAQALGLQPEPEPHGALAGALHALEVLRTLRARVGDRPYVQAAA
jgi:DNA polymerase III alpha subunit (gram-positive type)